MVEKNRNRRNKMNSIHTKGRTSLVMTLKRIIKILSEAEGLGEKEFNEYKDYLIKMVNSSYHMAFEVREEELK